MKNRMINTLSRLAGSHFAKCWNRPMVPASYTLAVLDVYIGLRRMLPVADAQGRHLGNHFGSKYKPWKATQGVA